MNTLSYKTQSAKKETVERKWHIIDAEGLVVGRLSSQIAHILRGKHSTSYSPHVDCGDFVIVVNADKIRFTGNKLEGKLYTRYSGYPGGQRSRTAEEVLSKQPTLVIKSAVKGMLPKNSLGRQMLRKLFLYTGTEHPHQAQQPQELKLS